MVQLRPKRLPHLFQHVFAHNAAAGLPLLLSIATVGYSTGTPSYAEIGTRAHSLFLSRLSVSGPEPHSPGAWRERPPASLRPEYRSSCQRFHSTPGSQAVQSCRREPAPPCPSQAGECSRRHISLREGCRSRSCYATTAGSLEGSRTASAWSRVSGAERNSRCCISTASY